MEVLKWLRDVANVHKHAGTGSRPVDRLPAEHAGMLPYAPAMAIVEGAGAGVRLDTALPVESLQHPLSIYSELLNCEVSA